MRLLDKTKSLLSFVAMLAMMWMANAQNVSNSYFTQEGNTIKIYYDLDEDADINIYISTDGGKKYEANPITHVSNDAGKAVKPGKGKCAVWDVLSDRAVLQSESVCFKIEANSPNGNKIISVGDVEITMVMVKGGTYSMGCTQEQGRDCYTDERPSHLVTLDDYYIGKTEVTQAQWNAVMSSNPSFWKGDSLPVENVNYNEVQDFIAKLNRMTGHTFRLPTEAEWEYAARGGGMSKKYKYSGSNDLGSVAWYDDNSERRTHEVAQKEPNELGIYDMSGNVWEWCSDWHMGTYYGNAQKNPKGPSEGSNRVCRGGGWGIAAQGCRVTYRDSNPPTYNFQYLGFRLVMVQ